MSRGWLAPVDLVGTKDGVNTVFTIPSLPSGAFLALVHNTRLLRERASAPGVVGYTRVKSTVTLGLAPAADADLWAQASWDIVTGATGLAFDGLPQIAQTLLQHVRKTFPFSVRLYNKAGEQIEYLDSDVESIQWKYSTLGGCAEATVRLRRLFDDFGEIATDYGVEIWREIDKLGVAGTKLPAVLPMLLGTAFTGLQERRWSGFVRELEPILEEQESVELRCNGWSRQMEYIIVPQPAVAWTSMDIGAIVRDIIDTYVVPGTQINRTAALNLVPNTSIVLSTFDGETSAFQMISLLAELAGNAEWGVRADKEFYFLQRTSAVKQSYVIGDRVSVFRKVDSADDVVSRVYLRGAAGQRFTLTYTAQESGYYKDRTVNIPSVSDTAAATLWGDAYFARFGVGQPSGRIQIGETDDHIEGVGHPLGLLRAIGGPVFTAAGATLPALLPMKLASIHGDYTDDEFRINSVTYTPSDDALTIDVDLGERSSHFADYLRRIEYRLNELQQGQVL